MANMTDAKMSGCVGREGQALEKLGMLGPPGKRRDHLPLLLREPRKIQDGSRVYVASALLPQSWANLTSSTITDRSTIQEMYGCVMIY